MAKPGRPSVALGDRFWSKVDKSGPIHSVLGTRCWLWASNIHWNGYGLIALSRAGRRKQLWARAHRVAWELTSGPIPDGQNVCHRCDVTACVNPSHLFLGTHQDNITDSVRKGRYTAWRRTGRRLNGKVAKKPFQSAPFQCQRDLGALDGPHGPFEFVRFQFLPVVGEVR